MKIKKELSFKGEKIPYVLTFRNQKNIVLSIQMDKMSISAPFNVKEWEIDTFIYKHMNEVEKLWKRLKYFDNYKIADVGYIKILGEKRSCVFIKNGRPNPHKLEFKMYDDIEETIKKMYKKLSLLFKWVFDKSVEKYSKLMDLIPKNTFVKKMNRKWGVCFPKESRVGFNITLIHHQIEAIDSVVVHELAHLKYNNHSKDFKYFVNNFFPEYNKWQNVLNGK